jgi:hypothetical protein
MTLTGCAASFVGVVPGSSSGLPYAHLNAQPHEQQLQDARLSRSRQAALGELVPRPLKVLKAHLGEGEEVNPDAWRAVLRIEDGPKHRLQSLQTETLVDVRLAGRAVV